MINYSTTNSNLKRGICNYSKKICKGLNRPEMKFVCDMTYGMLASGSSMLSEIARNLNEKIPLIKTVNRLSRNLQELSDDECSAVLENYLKAIPHNHCTSDTQSNFSSDCLNFPQACWRKSREIWVI